jgi:uncharacterized protein YndB with AHSA1/START domain
MELTKAPSVDVGNLIRRPPHDVFEALADPSITTRFWYTKSTGRMVEGAGLTWSWEMYNHSVNIKVEEVQLDKQIRFTWDQYDKSGPSTVEFQFIPYDDNSTYLHITETGFTGDADNRVRRALQSTGGFTFLLSALKAALEHDVTLRVVLDAFPPNLKLPSD